MKLFKFTKKCLIMILALIMSCCMALGIVGCNNSSNPPEHTHTYADDWSSDDTHHWKAATCEHTDLVSEKEAHNWGSDDKCTVCTKEKPVTPPDDDPLVINDVTADVIDSPTAIEIGERVLTKVYIDDVEVETSKYQAIDGSFVFLFTKYGEELPADEYTVKLVFDSEEVTYGLEIVDAKLPEYTYTGSEDLVEYDGQKVQIPIISRLNDIQQYNALYFFYDVEEEEITMAENLEQEGATKVVLTAEPCTMKILIDRDNVDVKEAVTWDFEKQTFTNLDMFSFASVSPEGWEAAWYDNNEIEFNKETNEVEFRVLESADIGMRSDYSVFSYPVEVFRIAKLMGYEALSFYVIANEELVGTPFFGLPDPANKVSWNSTQAAGMRIFAASKRIGNYYNIERHNYVVWENTANYINRGSNGDQGDGVYVYKDVYASELSKDSYTQVVIDIDDFLGLGDDIKYFSFVLGGVKKSQISIGNAEWYDETEYAQYKAGKLVSDYAAFGEKNYASEEYLYRWGVHKNPASITRSFDQDGLKATVNTGGGHSKSQTNIFAFGTIDFKYAYEQLGYTHIQITWKASKAMSNPETGLLGTERCVRLFTKVINSTPQGEEIYVPDIGTTSSVFEISLQELIETKKAKYLCFVIGGEVGDWLCFEDIKLIDKDETQPSLPDDEPEEIEGPYNIFASDKINENAWEVAWSVNNTVAYNEGTSAMDFTITAANGVGMISDYSVYSYPIEIFKTAQAEGYKALSFNVKPNDVMAGTPWFNLPSDKNTVNSANAAGIRIFASTKRIGDAHDNVRHNWVVWENSANYLNRGNQGDGVYVYKDVYVTEMDVNGYTKVIIDIDEFLALGSDVKYFCFELGGVGGSVLSINGAKWYNETEYAQLKAEQVAADTEYYAAKNFAGENMVYRWGMSKGNTKLDRTYDENGLKATVNSDGGHSKSGTNIFALGAIEFKYAYEELGFTHIKITLKANKTMLNPVAETTGTGRCVRIFTQVQNFAVSGEEIDVPDLGTTSTTFEISLQDLIETKEAKYLCFVIGGEVGDWVLFENIQLIKK